MKKTRAGVYAGKQCDRNLSVHVVKPVVGAIGVVGAVAVIAAVTLKRFFRSDRHSALLDSSQAAYLFPL